MPLQVSDSQIRVVLLDIEGTTTPVDFVYKTLFPYASSKAESFLRQSYRDPELQPLMADLLSQRQHDDVAGLRPPAIEDTDEARLASIIRHVLWLTARDSKCTPLKTLQGKIWQQGYERGELHGSVYSDVPPAFERWRRQGRKICIYSSGSALAQQLLFRSTPAGDLTSYISRFFDTRIGAKTESDSYTQIAEMIGHHANEMLFVSDAIKEIDAARAASVQAVLCVREGKNPEPATGDRFVTTFDPILPDR